MLIFGAFVSVQLHVYNDSDMLILEFKSMRNVQTTFHIWSIYEIIFETIICEIQCIYYRV